MKSPPLPLIKVYEFRRNLMIREIDLYPAAHSSGGLLPYFFTVIRMVSIGYSYLRFGCKARSACHFSNSR